jgi:ABC-type sugar transport system ATPase subunit
MRNGEIVGTYNIAEKNAKELLTLMIGKEFSEIGKIETGCDENTEILVSAQNISIPQYNKKISLEVGKGEIIGVAGLQGHGQAEIVRTLHGLSGDAEILIKGRKIIINNPRQAVKNSFAFISGDREVENVFCEHSISANVTTVSELIKNIKIKNIDEILSGLRVRYTNVFQNLISLSGGNQQKVVVGRWTSTKPVLILADDPTKGIDVEARSELHLLFASLAKNGTSLIMVSSDDNELVSLCTHYGNSRVIILYEGEIVKTLRGDEITSENIIASAIPRKKEIIHENS